jgi:glucokinase
VTVSVVSSYFIGVDIGGSGIDAGLCDGAGALIARDRLPLERGAPGPEILGGLIVLLRRLTERAGVSRDRIMGIGAGVPGTVDKTGGEVLRTVNLPLGGMNLARGLSQVFDAPVRLENDANCAALGEKFAPGREAVRDMLLVTVGTGIGGGMIVGGEIYDGFNSAAGEIGHTVIVHGGRACTCGRRGCWEAYASASALAETAAAEAASARSGAMWELAGGDISRVTAKTPFDAARAGDAAAARLVREYISHLACGITNLINILQPQLVCIGGGVSNEPDEWLLDPLRGIVLSDMYPHGLAKTKIEKAILGETAGIIGAAMLARHD